MTLPHAACLALIVVLLLWLLMAVLLVTSWIPWGRG